MLGVSACTNQACCALTDSKVLFTNYTFYSLFLYRHHLIGESYGGGQTNISQDEIRAIPFLVPPLHEQRAIAHFLDRETAKLDALIHKSQRLIELLREKRQALISHAVTKGLDEHAETRDSGVEWLGQIPSHWEARRLKYAVIVNPPKSGPARLGRKRRGIVSANAVDWRAG